MSDITDSFVGKLTGGKIALGCVFVFAVYIAWLAVSAPEARVAATKVAEAPVPVEVSRYVARTVNVRATPNLKAKVVGQHLRGAKISGFLEQEADGAREWLRLADNSGYVSTKLLSEEAPPALDEMMGADYYFTVDAKIMARPDASSMFLGEGGQGSWFAVGRTGEWIEILWKDGKVAYVHRDSLISTVKEYSAFMDAAAAGAEAAAAGDAAAGAAEAAVQAAKDAVQY